MPLLTADGVYKRYGGVTAVAGVSLSIVRGECVGVIGSNGAGKTTLFQLLTGFEHPDEGQIFLYPHSKGQDAGRKSGGIAVHTSQAHRLARAGVGRTFQNLRLFEELTARENIQVAILSLRITSFDVDALLKELGLASAADTMVCSLPYGTRKLCELGRAVAVASSGCGLLFLDEPCAGLCESESEALVYLLKDLKSRYGLTLFVIEHHMSFVQTLCDRLYAMDQGKIIAQGAPQQVFMDAAVKQLILGTI